MHFLTQNNKIIRIITIGIAVHLLLLRAVFDTYFTSPLENGMTPVKSTDNPPSKRVVLLVADGLRSQAIYGDNEIITPYLTSIRKKRGSWGISYTRVPTESRPGHVAMLAGIFEDPSALFKGWKKNPVEFDSVINESLNAWCWGSPDIVPIFVNGQQPHIRTYTYQSEMQDFGRRNTGSLDMWVFNQVTKFLHSIENCATCEQHNGMGHIYFLHLLGIDTAGHAFKPNSNEYINNIKLVDLNIEKIEKLYNSAFPDKKTTFVFTSDHGMTDWGSHGSGLNVETFTPFIAWGAGIEVDEKQKDLKQIDIAPLLSALIGINFPVNSLGRLPYQYLDTSDNNVASMFLANTLQLFKIYDAKRLKTSRNSFFYKPFTNLLPEDFESKVKTITDLISEKKYDLIINECNNLIDEIVVGIDYYHNYYMGNILLFVSTGFIAWMIYLSTFIVRNNIPLYHIDKNISFVQLPVLMSGFLMILLCYMQSHPIMYYCYFIFPSTMCLCVLNEQRKLLFIAKHLLACNLYKLMEILIYVICLFLFIVGFFYRVAYSAIMLLMCMWIVISPNLFPNIQTKDKKLWIILCVILAIFPLLPVMSTTFQSLPFVVGFFIWQNSLFYVINNSMHFFYDCFYLLRVQMNIFHLQKSSFNLAFSFALLVAAGLIDLTSDLKIFAWFIFLIPIMIIPFGMTSVGVRLLSILVGFGPFYIMTSTTYEILFISFYTFALGLWFIIESKQSDVPLDRIKFGDEYVQLKSTGGATGLEDLRKCLIFMIFILIGFFGTGNMASMNSFDPMWVRCFLTVFSPFKMTFLIMLKLMIPFIYTTCIFRGIVIVTGTNLTNLFCGILLFSDVMVLYFMYNIRNVGSWLEIGTSLSHFIIMEVFVFGIILFYGLAYCLTTMQLKKPSFIP